MKRFKIHLKGTFLGLFIILYGQVNGLTKHSAYLIKEKGLYQENILRISQNDKGLMLFESNKGVVCYDGYHPQVKKQDYFSLNKNKAGISTSPLSNGSKIKKTPFHDNALPVRYSVKGSNKIHFKDNKLNEWIISYKNILKNKKPINIQKIKGFLQKHKDNIKFNTFFQSVDGVIWIGTNKGLFKIVEDKYKSQQQVSISLTNIQYYDLDKSKWKSTSNNSYNNGALIEIPSQDSPLRLGFSLANYHSTTTNIFEYRFKGLQDSWISTGTNNQIVCGNIAPGKYELEIRGKHIDGRWSYYSIPFVISTSISQSIMDMNWFIIFAEIILLFYFLFQSRLLSKHSSLLFKKNISEEINDRIEDDIARMGMEIELLRTHVYPKDQQGIMMKNISISSRNVISTIGDVLWMIDIRRDTIEHLLDRIKEQANDTLGNQGIETSFSTDILLERQSIPFIFKQSLFFFCKHTMSSIVMNPDIKKVHIILHENLFQFEVSFVLDKKMAFGTTCQNSMTKECQKLKAKLSFEQNIIQLTIPTQKMFNLKYLTPHYS